MATSNTASTTHTSKTAATAANKGKQQLTQPAMWALATAKQLSSLKVKGKLH